MADTQFFATQYTFPSSGSTFDITDSRIDGATIKGVLFFQTHVVTFGTAIWTQMGSAVGATDGTRQRAVGVFSLDNASPTDVARRQRDDRCICGIETTTSGIYSASFNSWITNGIRLDIDDAATFGREGWCVFICGDDAQCHVNNVELGTGTSAIDVTDPGFEPEILVAFGAGSATPNFAGFHILCYGISHNTTGDPQYSVSWAESDAITGGRPAQQLSTSYGFCQHNANAASLAYGVTIGSWDSSGFSATPSASAGNDDIPYMAINTGGLGIKLWQFATQTSTGDYTDTTPGFESQIILFATTGLTAVDTSKYDDNEAGGLSFHAIDGDGAFAAYGTIKDSDPTVTRGICSSRALYAAQGDGIKVRCNTGAITSTGITLSYDVAGASAYQCFGLAIEVPAVVYNMNASKGSYAFTGANAGLTKAALLDASKASYSLTGKDATFSIAITLDAEKGAYVLTGAGADLLEALILGAEKAAYALTVKDTVLARHIILEAEKAAYALTPKAATFIRALILEAGKGAYSLSVKDADLLKSIIMLAEKGTYALTGKEALLLVSAILVAEKGTYSLDGASVNFLRALLIEAGKAGYALTGKDADLLEALVLDAEKAPYTLTGKDATLSKSGGPPSTTQQVLTLIGVGH